VTDKVTSQSVRTAALEDLRTRWRQRYGSGGSQFAPNSKTTDFGAIDMAATFDRFNSSHTPKIEQVNANLGSTLERMTDVIERVTLRGESLTALTASADDLAASASTFRRSARDLRCRTCVSRWKWYIAGVTFLLVLLFLIVWFACGGSFQRC
jgi:hypothetical protein